MTTAMEDTLKIVLEENARLKMQIDRYREAFHRVRLDVIGLEAQMELEKKGRNHATHAD